MKDNNPSSKKANPEYFAEIIESCLDNFLAQCWQWNFFPDFGSLIQVENKALNGLKAGVSHEIRRSISAKTDKEITTLGVVTQIQTGSMDPMRYPFAYQKTEAELLAEQPQIFEFLKTTFKVQIVGYIENEKNHYFLPSKPCKIHSFVCKAPENIATNFLQIPDFLHLLFAFGSQISNLDELLIAILKNLSKIGQLNAKKLELFCNTFSLLSGNDYRRLKLFLKRIEIL